MPRGAERLGAHAGYLSWPPSGLLYLHTCLDPQADVFGIRSPKLTSNRERSPLDHLRSEPGSSQFHVLCSYLGGEGKASEMLSRP